MIDPIDLAVGILEECKRFSTDALTKYIHKSSMFQSDITLGEVDRLHQKIDIVIKELRRGKESHPLQPPSP